MFIKRRKPWEIKENQVTPEDIYNDRRRFLKAAGFGLAGAAVGTGLLSEMNLADAAKLKDFEDLKGVKKNPAYKVDQKLTSFDDLTEYNNFYEFGFSKDDPAANAHKMTTDPWSVTVEGHCAKPGTYSYEDLIKPHTLEERIYRFRCVEAWSAVVPWIGIPFADVLKRFEPTSKAKYVAMQTLWRPEEMTARNSPFSSIEFPYVEGLRLDEAMNELSLLTVGLYGKELPNQNGAPMRLIVPWKYGYKSIKSVVRISFVEKQPPTTWNEAQPDEYGFYSNVNPNRDHPRWSQKTERVLGSFFGRRKTEIFNGYGEQVAHLYKDMDLMKFH